MRKFFIVILMLTISGCGSLTSLSKTDAQIAGKLNERKTYCSSMPRVYSGVGFDVCHLNAAPVGLEIFPFNYTNTGLAIVDCLPSAVVDTLALVYTVPAQIRLGSIKIRSQSQ
jgi:uncharacterized protein YceK